LARHDPYAELAGDVAAGRGALAAIATGRLQQAARETRGHEFSPKEIRALQHEIAKADLKKRQENVAKLSDIRVISQDSVEYHREVFDGKSLPEGTYTPRHLQKVMGSFWSTYAGTPTKDVSGPNFWKAYAEHKAKDIKGFVSNPVGYVRDLAKFGKALGQSVGHVSDHLDKNFSSGWRILTRLAPSKCFREPTRRVSRSHRRPRRHRRFPPAPGPHSVGRRQSRPRRPPGHATSR
jgi:hypothetical protein